jgi:activator of HSP90 ATPase
MRSVIKQSVSLLAPADALFAAYLDPDLHAAITGSPVVISKKAGSRFSAFEGALSGTMLSIVEPDLIVQSWRSSAFNRDDGDSTLILLFRQNGDRGRIELTHLDVPDHDYDGVSNGWRRYYWTPWRRLIARGAHPVRAPSGGLRRRSSALKSS